MNSIVSDARRPNRPQATRPVGVGHRAAVDNDRLVIDISQVGAIGIQRYSEPPARLSIVATVRADGIDVRLLPREGHAR